MQALAIASGLDSGGPGMDGSGRFGYHLPRMTPDRRASLWLVAMCVIWGSTFFAMQMGMEGMATRLEARAVPAAFLFLRFFLAAALFPLILPRCVKELTPRVAVWGTLLALPFYAGFLLQVMGLGATTSTISAFITSLTVVLTPVLGRLFFGERLAWSNLAGAAIALAGVFLMTDPTGGGFGRGELLTVASVVAFSIQIQLTNVVTSRNPPEAVTFVMFVWAAILSGGIVGAMGVTPGALVASLAGRHAAWTIVYTATVCSIVAIAIMNRFQRDLPPTRAAVLYTLEPIFAAIFAAAIQGEPMTARKLAGGAVVVAGNLVCELFRNRKC